MESALLGFVIRVAQQKQGRGSAEALISLIKSYRSYKTEMSYDVLFIYLSSIWL